MRQSATSSIGRLSDISTLFAEHPKPIFADHPNTISAEHPIPRNPLKSGLQALKGTNPMTKRSLSHGEGGIDQRGDNTYRLRYRIGKGQDQKQYCKTFHGTLEDAKKELRRLLRSGDTGEHVAPHKGTVAEFVKARIDSGKPRAQSRQGPRSATDIFKIRSHRSATSCCRNCGR